MRERHEEGGRYSRSRSRDGRYDSSRSRQGGGSGSYNRASRGPRDDSRPRDSRDARPRQRDGSRSRDGRVARRSRSPYRHPRSPAGRSRSRGARRSRSPAARGGRRSRSPPHGGTGAAAPSAPAGQSSKWDQGRSGGSDDAPRSIEGQAAAAIERFAPPAESGGGFDGESLSNALPVPKPEGTQSSTEFLIEEFLRARRIDNIAGNALKKCKREVQLAVIGRGPFGQCHSPSTALFQRIREMEGQHQDSSKYVQEDQCVALIKKWNLDSDAQSRILCCSPDVQKIIFQEFHPTAEMIKDGVNKKFMLFASSLHTAEIAGRFNPKAVLESGMRTAEFFQFKFNDPSSASGISTMVNGVVNAQNSSQNAAQNAGPEFNMQRVEDFILSNCIEAEAAEILRSAPANVQTEVLKKGKLKCALSTPTAALLARIKSIQGTSGSPAAASSLPAHSSLPPPPPQQPVAPQAAPQQQFSGSLPPPPAGAAFSPHELNNSPHQMQPSGAPGFYGNQSSAQGNSGAWDNAAWGNNGAWDNMSAGTAQQNMWAPPQNVAPALPHVSQQFKQNLPAAFKRRLSKPAP